MNYNQLVMVNKECDKKNKFFSITDWTEQQIQERINQYPKDMWFAVLR